MQTMAPSLDTINHFVGCAHGDFDKVKDYLKTWPELIDAQSSQAETALQAAAHTGQKKIAEYLLFKGAPLDICTAALLGMAGKVAEMLASDRALAQAKGAHGIPVMFYPALGGSIPAAEILLAHGADINAGEGLNTPLHGAAISGNAEMTGWLLQHGARVEAKDYAGKTPLQVAVQYRRTAVEAVLAAYPARA